MHKHATSADAASNFATKNKPAFCDSSFCFGLRMGFLSASIVVLCLVGVAFSYYAVHIKSAKDADNSFQATCDLDETISCSSAIFSEYSNGFGIVGKILGEDHFLNLPNSYLGLIFFPIMLVLALPSSDLFLHIALLLSFVSTITSAYLIYVLVYILKTICLVCLPVHFINVLLFLLYTLKWRTVRAAQDGGTKRLGKKDN